MNDFWQGTIDAAGCTNQCSPDPNSSDSSAYNAGYYGTFVIRGLSF